MSSSITSDSQQQQNGAPSDVQSLDSTSVGNPVYDSVPGEKQRPPPLPKARKTTSNTMYATRGDTLHPTSTMLEMNPPDYSSDGLEAEIDYMSSKCLRPRVTCLFILVMISLFLAIVGVVLVLLLWFGVYGPATAACSSSGPTNSNQAVTGGTYTTSLVAPTPSSPSQCVCPTPDLSSIKAQIEQEVTALRREFTNLITQIEQSNNSSISTREFEVELKNVDVFYSCIYEYLSNCSMPPNSKKCITDYQDIILDGYYNLDLSCFLFSQDDGLHFAPVTNLRFSFDHTKVQCECAFIPLDDGDYARAHAECIMFRLRCPMMNNFDNVTMIKP